MTLLLVLLCTVSRVLSATWYPGGEEPMLGEQIDLIDVASGVPVEKSTQNWSETTNSNAGVTGPSEEVDPLLGPPTSSNPLVPIRPREREPFDEVEHIEPKQWADRPKDLPGQGGQGFQTTTQFSTPRKSTSPTTLAQRNPSTQRYSNCRKRNCATDLRLFSNLLKVSSSDVSASRDSVSGRSLLRFRSPSCPVIV